MKKRQRRIILKLIFDKKNKTLLKSLHEQIGNRFTHPNAFLDCTVEKHYTPMSSVWNVKKSAACIQ